MASKKVDFKHIRGHADFETVAAHYDITLEGLGPQRSALCPFHEETKPSCKINLDKKVFNCFACEAKGNILDFVMQMEDLDPRPAAIKLAEICGVDLAPPRASNAKRGGAKKPEQPAPEKESVVPQEPAEPEAPPGGESKKPNTPLTFTLQLDPRHQYLKDRGITEEIATIFGLGYCGRGMMKGRIAIPIHNAIGQIVAYAGRWAEPEPPEGVARYLLPKGFQKQLELFNLHRIVQAPHEVAIVESYWSVFRLHTLGIPVVSPMGRSVSLEQVALLLRHGTKRVCVLFDGDEPGRTGTATAVAELAQSFYVRAPSVPHGFKPHQANDDVLQKLVG